MILAEASNTELGMVVGVLLMLGTFGLQVGTWLNSRKTQRREVSFAAEFASKDEVAALTNRIENVETGIDAIRGEMKDDREALMEAGEARAIRIYDHIDTKAESISAEIATTRINMQEQVNNVLKAVSRIEGKVSK